MKSNKCVATQARMECSLPSATHDSYKLSHDCQERVVKVCLSFPGTSHFLHHQVHVRETLQLKLPLQPKGFPLHPEAFPLQVFIPLLNIQKTCDKSRCFSASLPFTFTETKRILASALKNKSVDCQTISCNCHFSDVFSIAFCYAV